MMNANGADGTITFDGRTLTIARKGAVAKARAGGQQQITLTLDQISGIQVNKPSMILNRKGACTVIVAGSPTHRRGESRDFDPFTVHFWASTAPFDQLADAVRQAQAGGHRTVISQGEVPADVVARYGPDLAARVNQVEPPMSGGLADQLAELARLHRAGDLTDGEYAAAKSTLLGVDAA